ncbi:MAG: hypothetical protein IPH88_00140 [Bacteroidales bacterium]|nr:hypothetical protein [Bacteroidales bacterium]
MNRTILSLLFISVVFLIAGCCNCTNEEQVFSSSDLEWFPEGEVGDSIVFENGNGETKTLYINTKEEYFSKEKCAGPCCTCPEDNAAFYDFQFTGEEIPNTLGIREGLTINLTKTGNILQKTFSWSCIYGSFHDFDSSLDTLTVNNKLYRDVLVKNLDVCQIRKIFFCKKIGLIRFDYVDGVWERME